VKQKLSILFFLIVSLLYAHGKENPLMTQRPKWFDKEKVFLGGTAGLQFGTSTFIDISPLVGYRFTESFSAGVGGTYQYFRYKTQVYSLETNVYGGRVFGRYFFLENFFAHTEYEVLNLEAFDLTPTQRVNVGSLLAGGGLIQRFGNNSGVTLMVLYNFTESYYTPYRNPIIRVGFIFGL
jgi:hypothetical protein